MKKTITPAFALIAIASTAYADTPTLGGPMSHILVTLFNQQIYLSFESPSMSTVTMQDNDGSFVGDAQVLNDTGYNAQFGWLANGFISLPPSSGIFIRSVSSSPYLSVFEQGSFDPIFGTGDSSSLWQWDGTMTHNWYSSDVHGPHHALYEVFVGDLSGNPLAGYQSGSIDLNFIYGPSLDHRVGTLGQQVATVPSTGSLATLMLATLGASRRRRPTR